MGIDQAAKMEAFRAEKAARDAKLQEEENERKRQEEKALNARREELKRVKEEKKQKKLAAEALARKRAEEEVYADVWTQYQQIAFENALLDNGPEKVASIE